MPSLEAKMNAQEEEAKSCRRVSCASTGSSSASNFRELDTEFLTTKAKIWIENILEKRYDEKETVADLLADGEILYKISRLIDELMQKKFGMKIDSPVSEATHFGKQSGKYLPYSHIDSFLKVCKKLGLPSVDLFSPPDAVEKRDVRRVCLCIRALSKKARSKDLDVPDFDLVTDFLFMPTDMVDAMQKNLEQNMYSMSSKTESNSRSDSKKGSGKNNEPLFTGPFEVSPEDPDEAESKLKSPVLESSDSILGENTGATIASHSVSPRSPHFITHGSSSKLSMVGGSPIRDSLSEVNAPLIPENDNGQNDDEGSRINDMVPTDALNGYSEKSGSLTIKNSLTEIKNPLTLVSNEGNVFNEYPIIIVEGIKDPVIGELEKIVPSNSDESNQKDEIDIPCLWSSLFSFVALEGDSDGVDNMNHLKADGANVHMTTGSLSITNSTMNTSVPSIPLLSINDSIDSLNASTHEEGGHSTSLSIFRFNEQGINDMEIECKNVTKTERVEFGTANPPKLDSLDADPENVLKECSKNFGSPSDSEAVSSDINPAIVSDINNVSCYNLNELKGACLDLDYASKGKLNIVDIDRVTMPREDILDMVNEIVPKKDGMEVDCMKTEPLHTINVPPSVLPMNNYASYLSSDTVNGGYAHSSSMHVSDDFAEGITDDREVDSKNVPKIWRVDLGSTDAPELETLDVDHENWWKRDSVDSYASVLKAVGIDTDTTNVSHVNNVNDFYMHEPQTKCLDIEIANVSKPDNGNTVQTDIVDVGRENVPKTDSMAVDCMPTDPLLLTTDAPSISILVNNNAYEEHSHYEERSHSSFMSVSIGTGQGELSNAHGFYAIVLKKEEVEGGPTNALELDSLEVGPKNAQKSDILFYDSRFSPQIVSVNIDQCVNKERSDIDSGLIPKRESVDTVNTSVTMRKVNSADIKCTVEVEEERVATSRNGLEADNESLKVLKSETVAHSAANCRTGDINFAVGTEEDRIVTAGNRFVADNADNNCKNVLKADNIDPERAVSMKTGHINCAVVTGEDTIFIAAGDRLETDKVDQESTNMLKSEIVGVDSVANKKRGNINFADASAEDNVVDARKGLEANIVNDDSKTVLKSETVDVDGARHMRAGDVNCAVATGEDSVNTVNGLEADIDYACKKIVEVDSAENVKKKINCSVMTEEECVVDVRNGLEADNIDGDSINVLKPDIVEVDSTANMKTGDANCAIVTEEKCAVNAGNVDDNSKNFLMQETVDDWSVVDMETGDINRTDVIEQDCLSINGNGLGADNVDNDSKNVLIPESVGVDSVVNMKTGYINFPAVTQVKSVVNAGNGLEEDNSDDHSKQVLISDAIVDGTENVKTRAVNHVVVVEEGSIVNACSGLEANNIYDESINAMNSETVDFDIDSALDIGCPIVMKINHAGNGMETHCVVDDTRNLLKLDTLGFDNPVNIKTGDINCPVATEVDSLGNSGNKLEAENIYNDARNVLKLDTDSSTNMKTGDIIGEVVTDDNNVVNAGNVLEANSIHNTSLNMLKLESVGVDNATYIKTGDILHIGRFEPSATPEENVLTGIASESRNQLKSPAGCEHANDNKDQRNETETSGLEKGESAETKHIRKLKRSRLWISVFAGGIAAVGTALVTIRWWNRKKEEYEIKEGDTLSDISKRAGKYSWKELILINPQIKNTDLLYPGQRLKLK